MELEILKALTIVLLTMVKFIMGPTLGYAAGYSLVTTIIITIVGMMLSVALFTFVGDFLKKKVLNRIFRNRKRFTKRSRRFVTIWKKYGVWGVAILTPLILTPIGGTILLTSFGTNPWRIMTTMLVSAVVWAVFFSTAFYKLGNEFIPIL